jgi:hypothetical protein
MIQFGQSFGRTSRIFRFFRFLRFLAANVFTESTARLTRTLLLQEEVLAETLSMIPDTKSRLENALIDLQTMMVRFCCFVFRFARTSAPPELSPNDDSLLITIINALTKMGLVKLIQDTFEGDDAVREGAEWKDAETTRKAAETVFDPDADK